MKKHICLLIAFLSLSVNANAANLIQVYQEALTSDPIYQQAIAQQLSNREVVPLNFAPLLPQASIAGGPSINKLHISGTGGNPSTSLLTRGYSFTLTITQTVFNFAQFSALSGAKATSKSADATSYAALQNLMLRTAAAYFTVLKDEDNLVYNLANKKAFAKQLDQINQQYKVGLKTLTDLDTAQASYDTASAGYIAAQTTLADDKENLRAITGNTYPSIAKLSEHFPLISPAPADMEAWVQTAERQNWTIKAAQYANQAAFENIKQQRAGHLPTVNLQGSYEKGYDNNFSVSGAPGNTATPVYAHNSNSTVSLNFGIPIFEGGLVVSQTNQARYNYQVTTQQLEQALRATASTARQSYLGIIAGIQKIQADKQAIKSTTSSLEGLKAGYSVGTQTLLDVLNQQQNVFQAETQYATDRYDYVNNLLALKNAAGTLSVEDLEAINAWLLEGNSDDDASPVKHHRPLPSRAASSARSGALRSSASST